MKIERTKNATRGIAFGVAMKLTQMVLPFLMRTALVYYLGVQYLGLNSLFASVLQVLNLAELGVGNAMVFSMYKPIVDGDQKTICALMRLYRKYYRIIGIVIGAVGLLITPLIPKLVNGSVPVDINIYVLYLIDLAATVITYWLFAYRNCLLQAHQRTDITSIIMMLTTILQYVLQFIVLVELKNYYCYVIVVLCTKAVNNVVTAIKTKRMYPEYLPQGYLEDEETKKINQRIRDLFTGKIGATVLQSADTIVISAFLGLTVLAVYQNYYFIMVSIRGFIEIILNAIMAGLGNSFITETKEKNYKDFKKFTFLFVWLVGLCTVCFLCLYQPFMELWMGKQLMLPFSVVICLCINFYVYELNRLVNVYKDAAGLWHDDRFRPLVTAMANVGLNLILVKPLGVYGVILATALSQIFIGIPWVFYNLFTKFFKSILAKDYLIQLGLDTFLVALLAVFTHSICSLYHGTLLLEIIVRLVVCIVVFNVVTVVVNYKTKRLREAIQFIDRMFKGKLKLEKVIFINK